ncbi:Gfo/Idh/MocA family oxidoreductase [Natronospirillum operosum]|uniref:Gfo/Idh/MocA family oxidoreductase n=1 Tax=Natronospirillum operosum TaxID=2759953 RepID=A0A4Z0W3F7_9GAMM|nr:Gfo/Idh/MocA family oxidoreductase [Natronospirillum operosum]TGG91302.1 Gfo/Idh/MocA family oxidoreductase [Natronospirillum operosum]
MAVSDPIFNWGIIAPGRIARNFALGLQVVPEARLGAVASRNAERGQAFADEFGEAGHVPTVHGDYQALLDDPAVDGVYIASPHRFHFEQALMALQAGKPVVCEKPLTVTAGQAEQLMAAAEKQGVFLMEALWSRFLPVWQQVRRWLDEDRIGRVHTLQSEFCMLAPRDDSDRLLNPELAGGNLLDMGIYCIALSRFVTGCDPDRIQSSVLKGPTGVDERTAAILDYGDTVSQFTASFLTARPNHMLIEGELGRIEVEGPFWASERARLVLDPAGANPVTEEFDGTHRASGFEYQIEAATAAIRAGQLECPGMPWAATLGTARVMDQILREGGVTYPFL